MASTVSIIIPCFNSSQTIGRAINSVIEQTFQDFEIIIVDDASADSDATKSCILMFNDSRIHYFRHENNRNGSAARNTGIKNSKGDWIAFLDADDVFVPEHIQNCLKKAVESKKNEADLVLIYSKSLIKTSKFADLVMPLSQIGENESVSDYLFCNYGFISTPSIFISKAVTKKVKWNEELIRHQDYDFLFQLEENNVEMIMSNHIGCIIYWENNDIEKKGGTWEYSLNFARKGKGHFSGKSYTLFVLKNAVYPLLRKRKITMALSITKIECKLMHVSWKERLFFIDYLFFGKLTLVKSLSFFKKKTV